MFLIIAVVWLGLCALPLIRALRHRDEPGSRKRTRRGVVLLAIGILVVVGVSVFFGLATEYWWFDSVGFASRFWTEYGVRLILFAAGAVLGALIFSALRAVIPRGQRLLRRLTTAAGMVVGALIGGALANSLWQSILVFANRPVTGTVDPIFGLDMSFYLFTLPLAEAVRGRLITITIAYAAALFLTAITAMRLRQERTNTIELLRRDPRVRAQMLGVAGFLLLLISIGRLLAVPGLMYSPQGAVTGVGWLEHRVLIATNFFSFALFLAAAIVLLTGIFSEKIVRKVLGLRATPAEPTAPEKDESVEGKQRERREEVRLTSRSWIAPAVVFGAYLLIGLIVPGLIRGLVLNPNQITLESTYIPYHIAATRRAFGVDDRHVSTTEYTTGSDTTRPVLEANQDTLDNVRLWDWRALQDNLSQQQEIRLYYEFNDVDVDRYEIDGRRREVMLSVRELDKSRLQPESQTWVSRHFKYTHGYGLVALPVHEFLPQGRPNLYVKNIPPETSVPRFRVNQPAIYYGERTNDHVYVKTTQQEFDYPSGDQNVYTDYAGSGGVNVGGFLRRLAFASRFDGYRQLFSSYVTKDSRIMFRRNIVERASVIAPFLTFDRDPYPVLTEDGRIVYIIDAYTTSSAYPYSKPYSGVLSAFRGINYIRNSVKVVVDAYDGSISFYVVTPDDPLITAFSNVFPDLFTPISQMPEDLKRHIRYPADLLTIQAEVYSVYHMQDVQVFYQREDVWEFATERYRNNFQSVEPYYVMLQYPDEDKVEFILMIPFTPKNKNVINAWMAGRSDYENYGTMTVYTFPKGVEVLGPRQIEARIDQNTEMSQALSLWGQRGSEVIRGNLLAIPLFANGKLYILYAEPIYLQAENAKLPEIKRVALADQDRVVWAEDFDGAIRRLLGELPAVPGTAAEAGNAAAPGGAGAGASSGAAAATPASAANASRNEVITQAADALDRYRQAVADGRYSDAGTALEEVQRLIDQAAGSQPASDLAAGNHATNSNR